MGKQFVVSVPHSLGREEALSRIKSLLSDLKAQHGNQVSDVSENWHDGRCDFSLKVKMFKLSGSIEVGDSTAEIRGSMPPGTGRFEGKAKAMIEERAKKLLS
ncbi:MAG TPA: polyhydroxyalkanoic acid system family protein [Actinomycetota bacterium]|nr:polyhydroxyalkanoic acid system family protein [Actinomycetota bacterium]